jgi:ABC-type nitrate/sulfonate/bicarbonate transport system permease component
VVQVEAKAPDHLLRPKAGAPPAKQGGRLAWVRWLIPIGTTVALLGLWELCTATEILPPQAPPFTDIADFFGNNLSDSSFWSALKETLWHWFAGLTVGCALGVGLGLVLGAIPIVQRLLTVPLEFLRPIPPIVYLPLLLLTMGATSEMVILLTAIGALWPMLFQAMYGVWAIDQQAVDTGRVFGLSRRQRLWSIMIPSVLPYLATGLRIASSLALVVAISIELIAGVPGLGAQISRYSQNAIYDGMYAALITCGLLGLGLNIVLEGLEKRLLHWHVSHRKTQP